MATYPEVQRKAQAELDEVIGPDRLPDFGDYDALPFLRAVLLECTRWTPAAPFVMPHRVIADDYFMNFFIPKGTLIWPVCDVLHISYYFLS